MFRAALDNPNVTVVAVNDPFLTLDYAVYQLQYDSVHGALEQQVKAEDGYLVVGDIKVKFFAERNPAGKSQKEYQYFGFWSSRRAVYKDTPPFES